MPLNSPEDFIDTVVVAYEDKVNCLTWPFTRHKITGHGQFRGTTVARIICEKIYGPPPTPNHVAAHSCGNGHLACCNKHHLRWATRGENAKDVLLLGFKPGRTSIISDETAIEMKRLKAQGTSYRKLGKQFGVSPNTAYYAIARVS